MGVHNMRWGFSKEVNDNKDTKRTNWGLYRVYLEWKVVFILINGANEMN